MIQTAVTTTAFERGIDPLFRFFTPDQAAQIASYRADETFQQRIEELATKSNEGELSDDERAEYEGYVRANKFVAVFQSRARHRLSES
ncbi:MAG: hypothetical protein H7062_15670 [Candidatus Saccharimonas sp.]|nr:hypothetical protein [Planctomycetaceae bacterium]